MSRSFKSLVAIVALVSAVLFTAVAVGQYLFVIYQLHEGREDTLESWAGDLRDAIAFEDAWNLQGYRRSTEGPDTYFILTATGTVVDTHGYLFAMLGQVSLPFRFEFERPLKFSSEVGEAWTLFVHKLRDGMVILGVRAEVTPENLQERFSVNASRFGSTVADAADTRERAIDESFDWAVIDLNGNVRWAIGGIPMKSSVPEIPDDPALLSARQIGTGYYASFVQPVKSRS